VISYVVLEVWADVRHGRIRDQDLPDRVREADRDGLALAEFAGVVIELCQAQDVPGDLYDVRFSVLDVDAQGHGRLPPVVGAEPGLEAGRVEKSGAPIRPEEGAPQNGPAPGAKQPGAVPVGPDPNAHELAVVGAGVLEPGDFLAADRGSAMEEHLGE